MKTNGNDRKEGKYYIGLDVGTESVGWAVTDESYNLLKCNGKQMWGVRLFNTASDAKKRRTNRTSRRRLDRAQTRLQTLEMLMNNEVVKVDPNFFRRLHESSLVRDDRTDQTDQYALFNDPDYTDEDYQRQYPTVYHLRSELIHTKEPHDIRLVYLAIHHILKSRGHFLYETGENEDEKTFDESYDNLVETLAQFNMDFQAADKKQIRDIMYSENSVTEAKKAMKKACSGIKEEDDAPLDATVFAELLAGAKVSLAKLFKDEMLTECEITSVSLKDDLTGNFDTLNGVLGTRLDVIFYAKELYDIAVLGKLMGNDQYISDAKIRLYDKNRNDLATLKNRFRKDLENGIITKEKYDRVFKDKKDKLNNIVTYMHQDGKTCSQDDFCRFLKKESEFMKNSDDPEEAAVYAEIENGTFLTKLRGTANGLLPYQLQLKELKKILSNASEYLPFLKEKDADGLTMEQKIISLCTFRIPYYVGPLNTASDKAWISRTDVKIYPWNFDSVVNREESAERFMKKLIGRCTYTGDYVIPMQSLLFSRYTVLNEINNIKVNGKKISVECKQQIYRDLFENQSGKITKKKLMKYMICNGMMEKNDEFSGVDVDIHGSIKSYHDFRSIIEKTGDEAQVEKIIEHMLVYGSDKNMMKNWLKKEIHGLDEKDITHILRLNYKDWGRLSEKILTGIYHIDEKTGEAFTIMDLLWNTNENFMQLMSSHYQFAEKAKQYREETYGIRDTVRERLDDLYIAPSVRRSIWQTLKVVDEIVDIQKCAPEKIFIEMARTSSEEMKKKRTESRKDKLMALYKNCDDQYKELYQKLQNESEQSLRRDKLYLYYTQFGKCMYSEEPIKDLSTLLKDNKTYDIDHIFPQSKILDNSIDNRVLVKSELNRDKSNVYPISDNIRKKMYPFWSMLHDKGLISTKKYERLKRGYELTDEELSSFVARQLVETQQSTKALASMLADIYPTCRLVYSKARNVHRFRETFDIPKFRDINDFHHAKDAYLNIVVGNTFNTRFTDQFFLNIRNEKYNLNRVFEFSTAGAWEAPTFAEMKEYKSTKEKGVLSGTIQTVYKYVYKNTPIVTFAPYRQKGELYNVQILPKGKGQLPIKEGKPIEKYGGYNKITGSYFFVVEHSDGKKRIRTIQPVYLYAEQLYREDPLRYCTEILHLSEPKIIVPQILMGQMLILDDKRLLLTGRTGAKLSCRHTYQLAIDDEHASYLKNLSKYNERCNGKALEITPYDHISVEGNIQMYDWFIERLNAPVYQKLFRKMQADLISCRETFSGMDTLKQAKLLLEILKSFKCDSQITSLKELNGNASAGIIRPGNTISNMDSAYVIHQSVTGLFETKVNLLED